MSGSGRQAERDAVQAAMKRLLAGTPTRSTGALAVLRLAAEAGVKRWVLTHKHPDLRREFEQQRTRANGLPAAYQSLQAKIHDLAAITQRLRAENTELRERADTYAQVIYELNAALHGFTAAQPGPSNVRPLRPRPGDHDGLSQ